MTRWAADAAAPLLADRAGASGTVVALRLGDERAFLTEGRTTHLGGEPVDADTRFEIGSLTKVLTALLFARQVACGKVAYDDPVSRFLPPGAGPRVRGAPMTLLHLATHTSGLPRLPPGLVASGRAHWLSNPYAAFSPDDLLRAVRRTRPRFEPGSRVRYSNFGVGLLGHLLAPAAEETDSPPATHQTCGYERALTAQVLRPLGLHRTDCAADLPQATGYRHGRARPAWRIPGLPGAGAARSSGRDLLRLLDALIDPGTAPDPFLRAGLADVIRPRLVVPRGTRRLGLVWNIQPGPGHDLYHHSGGTCGFLSFAGFSPQAGVALVALTNTSPTMRSTFIQRAYDALRSLATPRTG
ncbi:serine hydrolase domain-containing protein [Streptomyces sp. SPB162]|uniref:serine hydrolase domain-containing protein n=1 Tax=Streptomyces sp. SPB162 TaxID=2940560 RepID=UPI00240722AF|nr:serine hydrolase domain-containing protein [Streptomyces sp. SPB162]MDF9814975.1 D-alanyl-D-alanine-carboxypeptidase/D-alanyl-D-alanine-endopeptidase [Streptomyces sp. SPB162]